MTCPHCRSADELFGRRIAARDRRRYRRRGPNRTTAELVRAIQELGLSHATLLDIGAGIGAVHHELLGRGVDRAVHVEAASAYLAAAREETAARGHGDRVDFVQGDFVDLAGSLPAADVVTLDRVVCCYPDYAALLARAAGRCRVACALSFPRDRWYVRLVIRLQNAFFRLRRDAFRTFVHPERALHDTLVAAGFHRARVRDFFVWRVELYVR